jgi:hypothetical protein
MSAHAIPPQVSDDVQNVHCVTQRKYGVDDHSPWWQRWFFRWAYLPFVRFAFKRMSIPAVDGVEIEGTTERFFWNEIQGIHTDKDRADLSCMGEFWCVRPIPLNLPLPDDTAQYGGHYYPRAKRPARFGKPSFRLITKDRKKEEREQRTLAHYLEKINQLR